MPTERFNKIIAEVLSLTPEDRRRLLDHLLQNEEPSVRKPTVRQAGTLTGTVKHVAPDFDEPIEDCKEP